MSVKHTKRPLLRFLLILVIGTALAIYAANVWSEQVGAFLSAATIGVALLVYYKVDRPRARAVRGDQ